MVKIPLFVSSITLSRELPFENSINCQNKIFLFKNKILEKTFFPYNRNEWKNVNAEVRNAKSIYFFKNIIVTEKKGKFSFCLSIPLV